VGKIFLRALPAIACLAAFACVKSPKSTAGAPAAQPAAPVKTSPAASAPAVPTSAAPTPKPAQSAPAAPAAAVKPLPVKPGTGLQVLLTLGRDSSSLPEDFKIGPLSGAKDLSGDEAGAGAAASTFLAGLAEGTMNPELITSTASAFADSLKRGLALGSIPSSFRMGKPKKLPNGEIAFNVRLFKGSGSAEGEIYLEKGERKWLVSDFQINLSGLREERNKPSEKFFPNSYRWLLGE
jgi:hypothetical protein